MSDLVLVTGREPDALMRAASDAAGEIIPWVGPDDPRAADATVWCAGAMPMGPARVQPRLRWIHTTWAGVDRWLDRPEWRAEIPLTRTIADFPGRISEYVFGYVLAEVLGVHRAHRQQAASEWSRWSPGTLLGETMLIVGYGAIGRGLAARARAMGMTVLGIRRGPIPDAEREDGVTTTDRLPEFLPRAKVVVNLLPANEHTQGFWNADRLARFGEGAMFVNASRGLCVDDAALLAGLDAGRPVLAILDVFREEPLPAASPYWRHPQVRVTPHVAGLGGPVTEGRAFGENYRRWRRGEPLLHLVDRARGY